MSQETNRQILKWVLGSFVGIVIVYGFVLVAPYYLPSEDQDALLRQIILSVPIAIIGILVLTGALNFVDHMTHGDWLVSIEQNPMVAAVVVAAVCISVAIILTRT